MSTREMPYRAVGRSGLKVSALSIGGWTTFGGSIEDPSEARRILLGAYEAGINFFDMADVYAGGKAEEVMGGVLRELPRHHLVLSSKAYWPMSDSVNDRGLSRKHLFESIEGSLRRIGTDYLDIYFCHRFDPDTPIEETARAMDDLVRQGKVLYWGTSEWTGAQLREARAVTDKAHLHPPLVEQPQYNLLHRDKLENFVRPAAQDTGMGLVTWSPLASGLLSGKYDDGVPSNSRLGRIDWLRDTLLSDENRARVVRLKPIAEELGLTRAQLSLAWTLAQPGVSSVITGAHRLEQLTENLGALDVSLSPAHCAGIEEIFPSA